MPTNLPHRPNLEDLRRQAKELLADLADGADEAIATLQQHLPAANGLSSAEVRSAGFRLADAQSAIARKTGFASWPQLARHVEQLRALEGTWAFVSLEVDGDTVPNAVLVNSQILIDGDRFRTESPGAVYEGVFNIDVEADPHAIDLEFVDGPEAGNTNFGIFRLDRDQLQICLNTTGGDRPSAFRTAPGTGLAFEVLQRVSGARPESVTGKKEKSAPAPLPDANPDDFAFAKSATLMKLQGNWKPTKVVRDGCELPVFARMTGKRLAVDNEVKITFGGKTIIHALVRIDEQADPIYVDYFNLAGEHKGTVQLGILQWVGDEACFCMAPPGVPRPTEFESPQGSGRTLSQWKLTKSR